MQSGDVQIESDEWNKLKASKVLIDLIHGMLETNKNKRYTAEQCIKCLDKWIGELRVEVIKECEKKKRPHPKNVKPLSDDKLI